MRFASLSALAAVPANARATGLELEDLRQLVTVTSPAISPDGSRVVCVRSRVD